MTRNPSLRLPSLPRALVLAAFFLLLNLALADPSAAERTDESKYYAATLSPKNSAKSFLIYHVDTGREVASLNYDYRGQVASLTKMMTVLLAAENLKFGKPYKLAEDEAKVYKVEELKLDVLIDLAMVPSNNLACRVIARLISGSETAFVKRMNERALSLGMEDTLYANSSGLPSKQAQFSTARDQLTLALEILKHPRLVTASGKRYIFFHERWDSTMYYLKTRYPVTGIKTGWTRAAGRCLVIHLRHPVFGDFIVITLKSRSIAQGFVDAEIILSRFGLIELAPNSLLDEAYRQEKERKKKEEEAKKKEALAKKESLTGAKSGKNGKGD